MRKGKVLNSQLIIVSDKIRSGKTTLLANWLKDKNVGGFLTPDLNNFRMFYDILKTSFLPFETNGFSEDVTSIGRFFFLNSTFLRGCQIIVDSIGQNLEYFIIDEFGKLELMDEGFGPAINSLISNLLEKPNQTTYIIVVRDYLVEDFLDKFGLKVEKWEEF